MKANRSERSDELLAECRQYVDVFGVSLPKTIEIASLSLESKLPFKALQLREVLLWRAWDMARAAIALLEADQPVPAILLTRATMETFAVLFVLNARLAAFPEAPDIAAMDDYLMCSLWGARDDAAFPQATNIQTRINQVGKAIPEFSERYAHLSEYCHPNWVGLTGSYSRIDREAFRVIFGFRDDSPAWTTCVSCLSATLLLFHHYYESTGEVFLAFNDYFERAPGGAEAGMGSAEAINTEPTRSLDADSPTETQDTSEKPI